VDEIALPRVFVDGSNVEWGLAVLSMIFSTCMRVISRAEIIKRPTGCCRYV
jgi:hypothetical protein